MRDLFGNVVCEPHAVLFDPPPASTPQAFARAVNVAEIAEAKPQMITPAKSITWMRWRREFEALRLWDERQNAKHKPDPIYYTERGPLRGYWRDGMSPADAARRFLEPMLRRDAFAAERRKKLWKPRPATAADARIAKQYKNEETPEGW